MNQKVFPYVLKKRKDNNIVIHRFNDLKKLFAKWTAAAQLEI